MRIGFYQHGSVTKPEVAEAVSAMSGVKVLYRNAFYFNERETEKFDAVVVDGGKNSDAIAAAYQKSSVPVLTEDAFLKDGVEGLKPKKQGAAAPLNPDAARQTGRAPKKQGAAAPAKPGE